MSQALAANIPKLYLLKLCRWFMLTMPIIVPFYYANGMDMTDIMTLQAIFAVAIVVMEIPSGYFGDLIGRKKSLIVGAVLGFLGFALYSVSEGFWGFMAAEILAGIGGSFISGSDSALLYDTLIVLDRKNDYTRFEGRTYAMGNFAEAGAGILGGLLAVYSLRWPFYAQTAVLGLSVLAALSLIEPPRSEIFSSGSNWQNILRAVRYSLFGHPRLRNYIFLSSAIGMATLTMAWFAQPYFALASIPLVYYGVLWASLNLTVGFASWFAYRIQNQLSFLYIIGLLLVLVFFGYFGASLLPPALGIAAIFTLYLGRGIATPILKDLVNAETPSEMRATVLSVRSFVIRLGFAATAPLLGWLTDQYSLLRALGIGGMLFLVLSLAVLLLICLADRTAWRTPP